MKRLLPIALLVAGAALYPGTAAASTTQEAIFQDDSQMLGNPAGTLTTLQQLGVTRAKVSIDWNKVAPAPTSAHKPKSFNASDPASPLYHWGAYDQIVRDAQADGIAIDFIVTGPAPIWATGPGQPPGGPYGQWKPSPAEFGAFVRAAGQRYSGTFRGLPRVSFWSLWNEPNYGPDLAPQAIDHDTIEVSAAEYRGLLDAAWSGLTATGHRPGRDTILIGETAPRGLDHPIGNFSGIKPLRFLRALYCVDSQYRQLRGFAASARGCPTNAAGSAKFRSQHPALFQASGFADHPYPAQGNSGPPNVPTTSNPHLFKSDPDYADLPEVGRLERVLDRLNRVYGSLSRFAVWNTEYGYRTRPPDPHANLNQATAAYYDNWAEFLSWRQPRLVSYDQYLLVDPPSGLFASGLLLPDGTTPKATFYAFRMPLYLPVTSTRHGRRLEVWGCVRPAHVYAQSFWHVTIEFRAGSHGAFQAVTTVPISNPRGYFDTRVQFPASGQVRLTWSYPDGAVIHSRTVSITIH